MQSDFHTNLLASDASNTLHHPRRDPMAISRKRNSSDDDFFKVGQDATTTFDNSPSNPTRYASSENLDDIESEEDELEDEGFDDEEDDDEEEEEEYDDEDDDEDEYEDDDEDEEGEEDEDEDEDEDDHNLAKGPREPSVYRRM